MKQLLKKILRKAGWELRQIENNPQTQNRSTMTSGLRWLNQHQIPVATVLDVGASNGCWSEECMQFYPDADYLLFEPQPVHNDALEAFAKSHKNTTLVKKAVGNHEGETFFDAGEPFGGALAKSCEADHFIKVEMTTIDATVAQTNAQSPFLLKLDTHGYEKSILDGALKTLEAAEVLIIEAYNHQITEEAMLFWELCAYLFDKGFRPIDVVDVGYRSFDNALWQMDLIFVKSNWSGFHHTAYA